MNTHQVISERTAECLDELPRFEGRKLLANENGPAEECPLPSRQLECVLWLANGKTAIETGVILGLSPETIKKYLQKARDATDVTTGPALVALALRKGWIK